jgi:MarR family 2-MHQ and catechol resistance regulon transcriptional repressor
MPPTTPYPDTATAATAHALGDSPFHALITTFGTLRRVMDPYFATFGISGSQWAVLRALSRAQAEGLDGLRLTDIGERLLIRPPSVTGVVDRLQRMGLLTREPSPGDHRARRVCLTDAGRERVERVLRHLPTQVEAVLDGLDPDEQAELSRLLNKLGQHLDSLGQNPHETRPDSA